jgi:hypothetical protein
MDYAQFTGISSVYEIEKTVEISVPGGTFRLEVFHDLKARPPYDYRVSSYERLTCYIAPDDSISFKHVANSRPHYVWAHDRNLPAINKKSIESALSEALSHLATRQTHTSPVVEP